MARLLKLPYMLRERVAVSVPRIAPVGPFNFGDALRLAPAAAGRVAVAGRDVSRLRIAVDASGGCFVFSRKLLECMGMGEVFGVLKEVEKEVRELSLERCSMGEADIVSMAAVLPFIPN